MRFSLAETRSWTALRVDSSAALPTCARGKFSALDASRVVHMERESEKVGVNAVSPLTISGYRIAMLRKCWLGEIYVCLTGDNGRCESNCIVDTETIIGMGYEDCTRSKIVTNTNCEYSFIVRSHIQHITNTSGKFDIKPRLKEWLLNYLFQWLLMKSIFTAVYTCTKAIRVLFTFISIESNVPNLNKVNSESNLTEQKIEVKNLKWSKHFTVKEVLVLNKY